MCFQILYFKTIKIYLKINKLEFWRNFLHYAWLWRRLGDIAPELFEFGFSNRLGLGLERTK